MGDFKKLKEMDIEEIYHKTYISRKYIDAILKKDFSKFNRLNLLGFVKILERELELDLSDLKVEIDEYFAKKSIGSESAKEEKNPKGDKKEPKKEWKNKKNILYAVVSVLIVFGIFSIFTLNKQEIKKEPKDEQNIKFFKKSDQNITKDNFVKETKKDQNITIEKEKKAIFPSITIIPKQKIWIGIVYLDDYSRKNYITSSPVELNSSRDQLIVTGHGNLEIDIDGNITKYFKKEKLRFLYRAGEFEKIDEKKFIKFNRGKNW